MADTVLADTGTDEGFLLALLNSTPVIDGVPADDLADPVRARAWLAAAGGRGTEAELRHDRTVIELDRGNVGHGFLSLGSHHHALKDVLAIRLSFVAKKQRSKVMRD